MILNIFNKMSSDQNKLTVVITTMNRLYEDLQPLLIDKLKKNDDPQPIFTNFIEETFSIFQDAFEDHNMTENFFRFAK